MSANTTSKSASISTDTLFSLNNRVVLLTGATGHLGQLMARGLAAAGAKVVLTGRSKAKLDQLSATITTSNKAHSVLSIETDLTQQGASEELIAQVNANFGQLDILINNAYQASTASVETDTVARFDESYHLGVSVPFHLTQCALPLLEAAGKKHSGGASIINIASMYGIVSPNPEIYGSSDEKNPPHYGPVKAGLIQLTRYLACHLADKKIRVNALAPGAFPQSELETSQPDFHTALSNKMPMKRVGVASELVGPVIFLASDASSYMTGSTLTVDGGWTAW